MENNEIPLQLQQLEALESFINSRVESRLKEKSIDQYESEKTDQICAALAKAQGAFPPILTNRTNDFLFRQYSDLDIIMNAVRNALAENGLSITFQQKLVDDKTILVTRVRHESSQFIETRTRIIPSKNDLQTYASHLKAMKRHSVMSLLNITIQEDYDDDDGETDMAAVRQDRAAGTSINTRYSAKKESFEPITKRQYEELDYMLANYPDLAEDILERLKIESLADMPRSKYDSVRNQAQTIINNREGKGAR